MQHSHGSTRRGGGADGHLHRGLPVVPKGQGGAPGEAPRGDRTPFSGRRGGRVPATEQWHLGRVLGSGGLGGAAGRVQAGAGHSERNGGRNGGGLMLGEDGEDGWIILVHGEWMVGKRLMNEVGWVHG